MSIAHRNSVKILMDILQRAGRPLQNCNDWQDKFLMKKRTQKSAPLEDTNSHHGRLTIFFSRYDRSGFRSRILSSFMRCPWQQTEKCMGEDS
jgi:hypothetical protein